MKRRMKYVAAIPSFFFIKGPTDLTATVNSETMYVREIIRKTSTIVNHGNILRGYRGLETQVQLKERGGF